MIVCEVLALEIGSSYHLVAITVTRYIAIVYPLRYHIWVTTKTTTIAIAVIWILSQGSSLIMYTMYEPGKYEIPFSLFQLVDIAFLDFNDGLLFVKFTLSNF